MVLAEDRILVNFASALLGLVRVPSPCLDPRAALAPVPVIAPAPLPVVVSADTNNPSDFMLVLLVPLLLL